jgi:hypothetical protein
MTYKLGKKRLPIAARADSEWLADVRGEVYPIRLQFNPTAPELTKKKGR